MYWCFVLFFFFSQNIPKTKRLELNGVEFLGDVQHQR